MTDQEKKEYRHFGHHVPEEARLHARQAHEELHERLGSAFSPGIYRSPPPGTQGNAARRPRADQPCPGSPRGT